MKCKRCGKWNQATLPHCVYCGAPLDSSSEFIGSQTPAWQFDLKDGDKQPAYIRVDDQGYENTTVDPRDELAREMVDLKKRKAEGEMQQRRLREAAARRGMAPSGRSVRTTTNRSTFFSMNDNPDSTLRPVPSELVENSGAVDPNAQPVYTEKYRDVAEGMSGKSRPFGRSQTRVDIGDPNNLMESVYDGYLDTSAYLPSHARQDEYENSLSQRPTSNWKPKRLGLRRVFAALSMTCAIGLLAFIAVKWVVPALTAPKEENKPQVTVTATIRDDLAAHTITIPGEDGQRIGLRERKTSAIVTGGVATFDILDHVWYDDNEDYLLETMPVTLTPFLVTDTGKQTPLPIIEYEIEIPLSPIELLSPDSVYEDVATPMYNIQVKVREGSQLFINGADYSDLVKTEGGKVDYNATVQPIGENTYTFVVRSQYCRENRMTITLNRAKQSIPLDLASDVATRTNSKSLLVRATTLPGATVNVLTGFSDLNITTMESDGAFSFYAVFDHIGTNTISITADYPGKETTRVDYNVYYVPDIDKYSRAAWDMKTGYYELLDNINTRVKNTQIYVCIGPITQIEGTSPQRGYINCGTDEEPLMVYIENSTQTSWEEGRSYRLYADAYGTYSGSPWLIARYTYDP